MAKLNLINEENQNNDSKVTATRKSLQLPRRLFHMGTGLVIALAYYQFLTHSQVIYILGACVSVAYILEQIRISYPEYADKFEFLIKYIFRAEERLKESAGIPYAMAVLLTIISFPKPVALVAILTLAISDPLSAIVGIQFGKHKWGSGKSVEGSAAFFISAFIVTYFIVGSFYEVTTLKLMGLCFTSCLLITAFELIPLRIDDNLTIPLFSAFMLWLQIGIYGI